MNPYVWICTKIRETKRNQVGISTQDQNGLQSSQRYTIHHPTASISAHFIYIPYNKNIIQKMRLYDFIRVAYSQSQSMAHILLNLAAET